MAQLIPQARNDKNGRTVIRHMRSDDDQPTATARRAIPPVTVPPAPRSMAEHARDIHEIITPLAHPVPVPEEHYFEGFLELTKSHASDLPDLIKRVLTTGTREAQRACVHHVQRCVKMFRERQAHPVDGVGLVNLMMQDWNECNVRIESGRSRPTGIAYDGNRIRTHQDGSDTLSDEYWRGLAAARIIKENASGSFRVEQLNDASILDFINRAGESDDLAAVIDVGIERQTLDFDVIGFIINGSRDTVSLRDGIL